MLYIQKRQEPSSLTKYRKQKFAYYDGYPDKDDIREQLLEEQGHLCAYCMRRIDKEHMKIEHWYPEDRLTDAERLEYRNMLGACEIPFHITSRNSIISEHHCSSTCKMHRITCFRLI